MTPHGSSTGSGSSISTGSGSSDGSSRNPYDELSELASSDAPPPPANSSSNPYEALSPDADPYDDSYGDPHADGPLGFRLRSDHDEPAYTDDMPYLRAVRRRRRSRLRMTIKIAIACCVLLAFAVVGDRWAALYAEQQAEKKVQEAMNLHAAPEVHIRGFPFLTQLLGERMDDVDVTIPDVPAGRISLAQINGNVEDVKIVGDAPTSIKGAVLGRMEGDVLLAFDDLDRELGTSQVQFTAGGASTVLADGELPVAGTKVKVKARAQLQRTSDHGVGTTVDDMRLVVPGLFSFTPGPDGGLRLAEPMAKRVQRDAAKAKALFGVEAIAERFGLSEERAQRVRESEAELNRVTGTPKFLDKVMKLNLVDLAVQNPGVLQKIGVDPSLVDALKKIEEPKLAEKLSLSMKLPEIPGDVRLRHISVEKEGIRAKLTGTDMPFGDAAKKQAAQKDD
ncbi:DUF2993 domain-containing protein [Streptomyces xiaopingdaonensis]|uniref:LmeA family phospholipid-binding protein n=1 Tax=Streptomyces xiaopingdaonensis TaxID=1565415 RepID=UPI0002E12A7C|nr:DUF2993 domain-containing protein [Streptomyces xiaopingdaonensis]